MGLLKDLAIGWARSLRKAGEDYNAALARARAYCNGQIQGDPFGRKAPPLQREVDYRAAAALLPDWPQAMEWLLENGEGIPMMRKEDLGWGECEKIGDFLKSRPHLAQKWMKVESALCHRFEEQKEAWSSNAQGRLDRSYAPGLAAPAGLGESLGKSAQWLLFMRHLDPPALRECLGEALGAGRLRGQREAAAWAGAVLAGEALAARDPGRWIERLGVLLETGPGRQAWESGAAQGRGAEAMGACVLGLRGAAALPERFRRNLRRLDNALSEAGLPGAAGAYARSLESVAGVELFEFSPALEAQAAELEQCAEAPSGSGRPARRI